MKAAYIFEREEESGIEMGTVWCTYVRVCVCVFGYVSNMLVGIHAQLREVGWRGGGYICRVGFHQLNFAV